MDNPQDQWWTELGHKVDKIDQKTDLAAKQVKWCADQINKHHGPQSQPVSPRNNADSHKVESAFSLELKGESWYPKGTPAESLPAPAPKHHWVKDWDGDWVHTSNHPEAPTNWKEAAKHQAEEIAKSFARGAGLKIVFLIMFVCVVFIGGWRVGYEVDRELPLPVVEPSDEGGTLAEMIYNDRGADDATYHLLKLNERKRCVLEAGVTDENQ